MLHRFLQHNLAVIMFEAAYMDGYKNGRGLDQGDAAGRAWSFAEAAVAAAPPELHCPVYLPQPPRSDLEEGAVAYVVPDEKPGVKTLVRDMWMRGYHSRTATLCGLDFKAWVQQLRKSDNREEDEIKDQAYEAAIEVIRKHKHLMAVEYKPKWMLMVAADCSIGDYCGDQPAVGDFIEYGLHTVCEVIKVDIPARQAIVKRMNCCSSDSCIDGSDDRGVPRRAPQIVTSSAVEAEEPDPEEIAGLAKMAKEHPILDEMLKQMEQSKLRKKLDEKQQVSSAGVDTQPLNVQDEIARVKAEAEMEKGTPTPKVPLSQIKPAGFYKSKLTLVVDDITLDEADAMPHGIPRLLIVYPWKPVNVDILPPEKVAKSRSLKQLIRDEMLLPCSEEEAVRLQSDHDQFEHPLSASNTLGVLDRPVEDYVNTRTGTIRDDLPPDDVVGGPLTDQEMETYAAVGLGNVLEGFKNKMKMTGAAVGPEDALLEVAVGKVAVGKSKRKDKPAPKRSKKPKRKSAKK